MNRRQVLLGSAATAGAAALPALPALEPLIMPLPYAEPATAIYVAMKIIWDAKAEVMRMTYITPEMLYEKAP